MSAPKPLKVFYSYAHKDEDMRDELFIHLKTLENRGLIESWHDRQIRAGDEWKDQIDEYLEAADVILLLITPAFMASDYCRDVEMKRALERHNTREARVVPIILRPANWDKDDEFSKLQAVPKDAIPVTKWPDRDEAFVDVAQQLHKVILDMQAQTAALQTAAPQTASPPATPPPPAPQTAAPPTAAPRPIPPGTTELLIAEGIVDELASVFASEETAGGVLDRTRIPRTRFRPFGSMAPFAYWEMVCRAVEQGLVENGLAKILDQALEAYPYNQVFRRGRALVTSSGAPQTGAPQTGAPQTGGPPMAASESPEGLDLWRAKLNHYLKEEAITSDPSRKFELEQLIHTARAKIRELGGP